MVSRPLSISLVPIEIKKKTLERAWEDNIAGKL
jgi:hypothetical protein